MTRTGLLVLFASALVKISASSYPSELENHEPKEEYDGHIVPSNMRRLNFELEHQLGAGEPFKFRGVVEIVVSASFSQPKVSFSALPSLSIDDLEKLETLLKQRNLYTVRAKGDPADPDSQHVMTSVPMCMLAAMHMREDFAFHISDSGKLISIEYLTPYLYDDECASFQTRSLKDVHFGPFGTVFQSQAGSVPPKNIMVKRDRVPQGVEPVKTEDNNEEAEEESQSFLRKYWYIILPIVVLSLFGGDNRAPPPAAPVTGGRRR